MVAQKCQKRKTMLAETLCIFQHLLTQNPTCHGSPLSWFFQTILKNLIERLLENPKTEVSRELFLPKNNFKTCYTVSFLIKHPDFGGLETNQRYEIQTLILFYMPLHIYELNNIKTFLALNRNLFKVL